MIKERITEDQFILLYARVRMMKERNPQWRMGQSWFNTLYELHPTIANEIRGTKLDSFYQNKNISNLVKHLIGV